RPLRWPAATIAGGTPALPGWLPPTYASCRVSAFRPRECGWQPDQRLYQSLQTEHNLAAPGSNRLCRLLQPELFENVE
ncbi:MAG: hypothetical protein L0312_03090, partial [Acidobacteria bacterium]|nr:hypothetical protein [Acidobacteriota bacterium]